MQNSRSHNGKWSIDLNFTQDDIQPIAFDGNRVTFHDVETILIVIRLEPLGKKKDFQEQCINILCEISPSIK